MYLILNTDTDQAKVAAGAVAGDSGEGAGDGEGEGAGVLEGEGAGAGACERNGRFTTRLFVEYNMYPPTIRILRICSKLLVKMSISITFYTRKKNTVLSRSTCTTK